MYEKKQQSQYLITVIWKGMFQNILGLIAEVAFEHWFMFFCLLQQNVRVFMDACYKGSVNLKDTNRENG